MTGCGPAGPARISVEGDTEGSWAPFLSAGIWWSRFRGHPLCANPGLSQQGPRGDRAGRPPGGERRFSPGPPRVVPLAIRRIDLAEDARAKLFILTLEHEGGGTWGTEIWA